MKAAFASSLVIAMMASLMTISVAQTAPGAPAKVTGSGSTALLTDGKGMTLYVNDKDTAAKSTCNGTCATNWPPLAATSTDKPVGKFTIVVRDDGTLMWAYAGKPLYDWKNDKAPGDTTGEGVGGVWHVARPSVTPASAPGAPAPPGGGPAY